MNINAKSLLLVLSAMLLSVACAPTETRPPVIPSLEYSKRINDEYARQGSRPGRVQLAAASTVSVRPAIDSNTPDDRRAKLRMASADGQVGSSFGTDLNAAPDMLTNMPQNPGDYTYQESMRPLTRDYSGPLPLGDPGTTASLWHESRGNGNEMFRDNRAWQAMDLITIVVSEKSKGEKSADTEVKSKTDVSASISQFFGLPQEVQKSNPNIDPTALIAAATKNDYKGEGDTSREGSLVAKISAMVVEVLPSGILRIEGEKIVSVNSEEEIMVLSGLVRPEDVSSDNEVNSAKIADMRIDYYGTGTVGDAQHGGWVGRLLHRLWPF